MLLLSCLPIGAHHRLRPSSSIHQHPSSIHPSTIHPSIYSIHPVSTRAPTCARTSIDRRLSSCPRRAGARAPVVVVTHTHTHAMQVVARTTNDVSDGVPCRFAAAARPPSTSTNDAGRRSPAASQFVCLFVVVRAHTPIICPSPIPWPPPSTSTDATSRCCCCLPCCCRRRRRRPPPPRPPPPRARAVTMMVS